MKNNKGIYMFTFKDNDKSYIGSSETLKKRKGEHLRALRRGDHWNTHFQRTYNLYGETNLIHSILEITSDFITKEELLKIETFWVLHLNTHLEEFGFNKTLPGSFKIKDSGGNKINDTRVHKDIVIIDKLSGGIDYAQGAYTISERFSIDCRKVQDVLNYWAGKKGRKSVNNKIFVYKDNYNEDFDYINYRKPTPKGWRKPNAKCRQVKEIKPIEDRNLKRCPVILKNISTGEEEQFVSVKKASEDKCLNYTKLHKLISAEFEKYSHRGYYAKRA